MKVLARLAGWMVLVMLLMPGATGAAETGDQQGGVVEQGASAAVVDVGRFGAIPNDGEDDTAALRAAVNYVVRQGGTLQLGSGVYEVSRTINLSNVEGLGVQGQGSYPHEVNLTTTGKPLLSKPLGASVLKWTGPAGGTVLSYGGSGAVIDGVTIWGAGRAGVGFQLYKASGVGSGHSRFPTLAIAGCTVAFRCGEAAGDGNCGDLDFGVFDVTNCGTGFQVVNDQGVNYSFSHANFSDTDVLFDFKRGGNFNCQFVHAIRADTILRIGHPGSGNGLYRIGMISLDANQKMIPRLVDQQKWGPARIVIESAKIDASTPARDEPLLRLYGDALCRLSNVAYLKGKLYKVTAGSKPHRPVNLILDGCILDKRPQGEATGPLNLSLRNCFNTNGIPMQTMVEPNFD